MNSETMSAPEELQVGPEHAPLPQRTHEAPAAAYAEDTAEEEEIEGPFAPVFAGAASGRLLAITTLEHSHGWCVSQRRTRAFHLAGRSQREIREFASQVHEFTNTDGIKTLSFCRMRSGLPEEGLADEVRIESALKMIPGLDVIDEENDDVATWAIKNDPAPPENSTHVRGNLAQFRAIELAQFVITHRRHSSGTP